MTALITRLRNGNYDVVEIVQIDDGVIPALVINETEAAAFISHVFEGIRAHLIAVAPPLSEKLSSDEEFENYLRLVQMGSTAQALALYGVADADISYQDAIAQGFLRRECGTVLTQFAYQVGSEDIGFGRSLPDPTGVGSYVPESSGGVLGIEIPYSTVFAPAFALWVRHLQLNHSVDR